MLTPKRLRHSINVQTAAEQLAKRWGCDPNKASIAGLVHDCAKDMSNEDMHNLCKKYNINLNGIYKSAPKLVHAPLGAKIAEHELGIKDKEILSAITCHTTGKENMSLLDKIIYIADFISIDRKFEQVDSLRQLSEKNLDKALIYGLDLSIKYVMEDGGLIHLDTVRARNYLIGGR